MSGIEQIHETTKAIAQLGRFEDDFLAHVAKGEMVVPGDVLKNNPKIKKAIFKELKKLGVKSPSTYIVGSKFMRINPMTGQPEFFLKQIFKAAKDIFSSPLGGAVLGLGGDLFGKIPGIGGGIQDLLSSRLGRGITSAGIAALLGAKPKQALLSGLVGGALGKGSFLPGGEMAGGEGGSKGTFGSGLKEFFMGKEAPDRTTYILEKVYERRPDFDSLDETTKKFLYDTAGQEYDDKFADQRSGLEKLLPFAGPALGIYALLEEAKNRPQYDPQQNPYLYAQGGQIPGYAYGGGTMEFPRRTDEVKGPGDGQSDSIPAMLSNDEHILTKREVETIGRMAGGNVDTGHEILKNVRSDIDNIGAQMGVSKA